MASQNSTLPSAIISFPNSLLPYSPGKLTSYSNIYVSYFFVLSPISRLSLQRPMPLNISYKTNVPEIWLPIYYYCKFVLQFRCTFARIPVASGVLGTIQQS